MKYILTAVSVSVLIVGAVFITGAVFIAEKKIGDIIGKIVDKIFREEY